MRLLHRLAAVVVATILFGLLIGSAGGALGSCARPPPLEQGLAEAETVFVGRVVELENNNRWAVFVVEEIWRGGDLPSRVSVRGGPGSSAGTSVDRTYEPGRRYLVVPVGGAGPVMEDNACTLTQPYGSEMDALRPANPRVPTADRSPPMWSVVALAVLVVSAVAVFAVHARRSIR